MRTNGNHTTENRAMISSASNFFNPVHVQQPSRAGFETVEQFLARGGTIEKLQPGDSAESLRKSDERKKQWSAGKLVNPI